MARLILAHPLFLSDSPAERESASPYFPLGILCLAAYVRDAGHHVTIFDGTFARDESAFDDALERDQPDLVGITALLPLQEAALRLAAMAEERGIPVVVGGPDATTDPQTYARHGSVDVVVHHEGEQTLVRVLELIDRGQLTVTALRTEPGVAVEVDGRVLVNAARPPLEDLDSLPLPARDLIDMERYLVAWRESSGYASMTIATSRGCPHGCEWCRDSVHGRGFRQRSPGSVAAEVKAIADRYDVERLRLVDDVDGISREWIDAWAVEVTVAGTPIPFEALNELERRDLPLLDVRDSL